MTDKISDESSTLQTFAQHQLRVQVKESFLDLSAGFNLEASRLRDALALSQLWGVMALTTLFLVLQGTQGLAAGHELFQARLELDSPRYHSAMAYPSLLVSIEFA